MEVSATRLSNGFQSIAVEQPLLKARLSPDVPAVEFLFGELRDV
jgi:hypothetical protein